MIWIQRIFAETLNISSNSIPDIFCQKKKIPFKECRNSYGKDLLIMRLPIVSVLTVCAIPIATFAASDITSIEDVKRGQTVTIQGTVDRIMDTDEFRVRDATGSLRVYVGPNWMPADVGEQVTITGIMDDDLLPRPELYAREIIVGDEPPVTLEYRYE